jgi:hypothetical protein
MVKSILRQRFVVRGVVWLTALLVAWGVSKTTAQTNTTYIDPPIRLPSSGFSFTRANGINDAGRIVGTGFTSGVGGSPLLWMSATATPTVLPTGGFSSLEANNINNVGQIVGIGSLPGVSGRRPAFWANVTADPVVLSTGGVSGSISAEGINDDGQIVGWVFSDGVATPLFWANPSATPTVLPSGEFTSVSARGINNVGQIVGDGFDVRTATPQTTALFWASPTDSPGTLPVIIARGLNDGEQIVGGQRCPFFFDRLTSQFIRLPDGGFNCGNSQVVATDINNIGHIVGWSPEIPLLWIPVPLLAVDIDVLPGEVTNPITPNNRGRIPVAILTTASFEATSVDASTVRFGRTGQEAAPVRSAVEDVDADGDRDLLLFFNNLDTGIQCGDTSASLTGRTFNGEAIQGSDAIRTVGCR